jgi:CBS domain-containing protein
MLVEQIFSRACERLAIIEASASVKDAADLMTRPHTDLLIVCDEGVVIGVVTKTDIVLQVSRESGLGAPVRTIMARDVACCRVTDKLPDVLQVMKERGFHRIPVVNARNNPIGIVYARDALRGLLKEVEIDDALLRDFISGMGYR